MRNLAVSAMVLGAVLLVSCGGGIGPDTLRQSKFAEASIVVNPLLTGPRGNYVVSATTNGYVVTDVVKGGAGIAVDRAASVTFSDVKVNFGVIDNAAAIPADVLRSIEELYVAYFNRVPDADGLNYWINAYRTGQSLEKIGQSFYAAAIQYSALTGYTNGMSDADFVKIVYKNVLGRDSVDSEGLAYWTGTLATGKETRGTLVKTILGSAHSFKGNVTLGYVADLLDNKVAVADYFARQEGLGFNSSDATISKGMQIAAAVSASDISTAIKSIPKNYGSSYITGMGAIPEAPLAIAGVSNASPRALSTIAITLKGFVPTLPVVVTLIAGANASRTLHTSRGLTNDSIRISIPLVSNGLSGTAAYSGTIAVTQGGKTVSTTLNVSDIPTFASFGTTRGAITHAYNGYLLYLLGQSLNGSQALLQSTVIAPPDAASAQAITRLNNNLSTLINDIAEDDNKIAAMIRGEIQSYELVRADSSPGAKLMFDAAGLELSDRIIGTYLTDLVTFSTKRPLASKTQNFSGQKALLLPNFGNLVNLVSTQKSNINNYDIAGKISAMGRSEDAIGFIMATSDAASTMASNGYFGPSVEAGAVVLINGYKIGAGLMGAALYTSDALMTSNSAIRALDIEEAGKSLIVLGDGLLGQLKVGKALGDISKKLGGNGNFIEEGYDVAKSAYKVYNGLSNTYQDYSSLISAFYDRLSGANTIPDGSIGFIGAQSTVNIPFDFGPMITNWDLGNGVVQSVPGSDGNNTTVIPTTSTSTPPGKIPPINSTTVNRLPDGSLLGSQRPKATDPSIVTQLVATCKFSGAYTGSFSGSDSGTAAVNFSSTGVISGTASSRITGQSIGASGTISSTGKVNLLAGSTSTGASFSGQLVSDANGWSASGNWSNASAGTAGTYSLTKPGC